MAKKDLSFTMVLKNPDLYRGETVIWGGLVIETLNRQDGTVIKIIETPLDDYELPGNGEKSRGRFLVKTSEYLDPEVYRKGRKVTVAGKILGKEVQPLGEIQYEYPVVSAAEVHLWRNETSPPPDMCSPPFWSLCYDYPGLGSHFYPWYPGPVYWW